MFCAIFSKKAKQKCSISQITYFLLFSWLLDAPSATNKNYGFPLSFHVVSTMFLSVLIGIYTTAYTTNPAIPQRVRYVWSNNSRYFSLSLSVQFLLFSFCLCSVFFLIWLIWERQSQCISTIHISNIKIMLLVLLLHYFFHILRKIEKITCSSSMFLFSLCFSLSSNFFFSLFALFRFVFFILALNIQNRTFGCLC